jgi:hypothetical protein
MIAAPPLLELRNVSVVRGESTLALDRVTLRVGVGEHLTEERLSSLFGARLHLARPGDGYFAIY